MLIQILAVDKTGRRRDVSGIVTPHQLAEAIVQSLIRQYSQRQKRGRRARIVIRFHIYAINRHFTRQQHIAAPMRVTADFNTVIGARGEHDCTAAAPEDRMGEANAPGQRHFATEGRLVIAAPD
ncbi:hypothetical protein D3C71_1816510 [compost metagenome]